MEFTKWLIIVIVLLIIVPIFYIEVRSMCLPQRIEDQIRKMEEQQSKKKWSIDKYPLLAQSLCEFSILLLQMLGILIISLLALFLNNVYERGFQSIRGDEVFFIVILLSAGVGLQMFTYERSRSKLYREKAIKQYGKTFSKKKEAPPYLLGKSILNAVKDIFKKI